jgi:hypothetical protein
VVIEIERRGNVLAPKEAFDWLPKEAERVASWANGKSQKTWALTREAVMQHGCAAESVFDAAHGFRYMLFVYKSREERKAIWDFLTGALD